MTEVLAMEMMSQGMSLLFSLGAPFLFTALGVGIFMSLIQTLTHVQDMTVAFIPKLFALFLVLLWCLPHMGRTLNTYIQHIFHTIVWLP